MAWDLIKYLLDNEYYQRNIRSREAAGGGYRAQLKHAPRINPRNGLISYTTGEGRLSPSDVSVLIAHRGSSNIRKR